jgi:hypothetical protein
MNEEVFAYCAICEKEHMLLRIDSGTAINDYDIYLCKITDKFFLQTKVSGLEDRE